MAVDSTAGKIKVIHILHHSYSPYLDHGEKITPERMRDDWHFKTAYYLKKYYPDEIDVECWRPEYTINKPYDEIIDGIKCRIFPSWPKNRWKFGYEISMPLLKELQKVAKNNKIIVHMHGIHNLIAYTVNIFIKGNTIKVGHHHGGIPRYILLKKYNRPFYKKILVKILSHVEVKSLKRYNHVFAISDKEIEFLKPYVKSISKQTMGANFDLFCPVNKMDARKLLGIPLDKKVLLYVGRFNRLKGVDRLIDAYKKIQEVRSDTFLIMIGGHPDDELYHETMKIASIALKRIPSKMLVKYYSAADVYILPATHPYYNGGIGIAPIEAMACNCPVISSTLKEFAGTSIERDKCGIVYKDGDKLEEVILRVMDNLDMYSSRDIVKKYYSWNTVVRNIYKIYRKL